MARTSSPDSSPKVFRIHRFQIGLNVLIQLLVVAGIVAMCNYLSFRHFKRWDLSRDHKYALSSQTKNLLGNLKKPVKAVLFFSSATEITPDVNALLREYEYASNNNFNTEVVDPYRSFTRASELQAKYKFGANENILILDYDGRNKFVNAADMADYDQPDQMAMMMGQVQPKLKAFKGEQAITSALLELTENKPNKVYYVTGHGEIDLNDQKLKIFNEGLKRQNIQIAPLNLLNVNNIPEDARAVILNGPTDLSELEIKLLSDYWEQRKGRLSILLSPYARTPRLAAWLTLQGITPQEDRVVRTGTFALMDQAGGPPQFKQGTVTRAVYVVLDSGTAVTKDLVGRTEQLLGYTQSLAIDRTKEAIAKIKLSTVLEAGEGFWGETDPFDDEHPATRDARDHNPPPPLVIAAVAEKGAVADLKVPSSRLLVVGNSDLLTNDAYRLSNGINLDVATNSLNWLLDRDDLVGIAPKEKKSIALSLDERQLRAIALGTMVLIPGFVAMLGLLNWWQRRA